MQGKKPTNASDGRGFNCQLLIVFFFSVGASRVPTTWHNAITPSNQETANMANFRFPAFKLVKGSPLSSSSLDYFNSQIPLLLRHGQAINK
jgi:hypothetical protein